MDFIYQKKKYFVTFGLVAVLIFIFLAGLVIQYSRSPSSFPVGIIVTIPVGTGVSGAGAILEKQGVIRSAFVYKIYTVIFHEGHGIQAGQYLFDAPQSVVRVAYRVAYGIQELSKIKVTIPEGSNSKDITRLIGKAIPNFASSTFYILAKLDEGYLFPDTYYFYRNTTPKQVISQLKGNFSNQVFKLTSSTAVFENLNKVSFADIITMASIVEKEATSTSDRQVIAGILWKRLADKYPLQVDPPFYYILGKDSSQLTSADLAIDSPFNLYKNKGLPPTPIDNPGIDALYATTNPTNTKYWYYLSDAKGNMHYAVTYAQHLVNKAKYVN